LDNVCNLLFELSSTDRLNVLLLLRKTPMKLSRVASKLDFTVQETSRNLARLSDAKLIKKDVNGAFYLTPYGEEALNLLSGFKFLFKNKEYFIKHTISCLPKQFETSLGMLENSEHIKDVMISFRNIEEMIARARESVWILTDQVLASTIPFLVAALERGLEFKLLMPKAYVPTPSIRELVSHPVFRKATYSKKLESRFLDKVCVVLCLSESEVATIAFPNLEREFDYTGFKSENPLASEWSKALYAYYWERGSPEIPDKLIASQNRQ
jgi:predicted transcriptional regulator